MGVSVLLRLFISSNEACNTADPFDADSHLEGILLNISSRLHAPQGVQQSLLSAVETGEKKLVAFVKETLSTEGGSYYKIRPVYIL